MTGFDHPPRLFLLILDPFGELPFVAPPPVPDEVLNVLMCDGHCFSYGSRPGVGGTGNSSVGPWPDDGVVEDADRQHDGRGVGIRGMQASHQLRSHLANHQVGDPRLPVGRRPDTYGLQVIGVGIGQNLGQILVRPVGQLIDDEGKGVKAGGRLSRRDAVQPGLWAGVVGGEVDHRDSSQQKSMPRIR